MEKKMIDRMVYYVAFPLVVTGLCIYSYYLGYTKGTYSKTSRVMTQGVVDQKSPDIKELEQKKLTFFKELRPRQEDVAQKAETWVQVSAFQKIGKADELLDRVKNEGFRGKIESESAGDGLHRVYVGPYKSLRAAEEGLVKLEQKGFGKGFVVNQ